MQYVYSVIAIIKAIESIARLLRLREKKRKWKTPSTKPACLPAFARSFALEIKELLDAKLP